MDRKNAGIDGLISDLENIDSVFSVILFGSVARGENKPVSDIDLCILTEPHLKNETKSEIASYGSDGIDISFFWDLPSWIRYNVLREGRVLFNKNKEALHEASVKTMSEYLDFKPILERNIKRVFGG